LHDRANRRKREAGVHMRAFRLEKVVRDRGEHDVMMPTEKRPAFEMIEAKLGFELLVLLLDGPSLMCEPYDLSERRRGRQRHKVVLGARRVAEIAFAEEPDFWRESAMSPVVRGRYADRETRHRPLPSLAAVAPTDTSPGPWPGCRGDRLHAHRTDVGGQLGMLAWTSAPKDGHVRRDPDSVREAQPVQHGAKQPDIAELRVGEHAGNHETARAHLPQQRQRLAPFFLKADR